MRRRRQQLSLTQHQRLNSTQCKPLKIRKHIFLPKLEIAKERFSSTKENTKTTILMRKTSISLFQFQLNQQVKMFLRPLIRRDLTYIRIWAKTYSHLTMTSSIKVSGASSKELVHTKSTYSRRNCSMFKISSMRVVETSSSALHSVLLYSLHSTF